jgi:predicted O-linked N-acetylglucosamine transferase (SPINDLY family)
MGVPVITFPGKTFAGRHAVSHLTNAGYPQFIAGDLKASVELAVQWANRPDELAILRTQMRDQMRSSPLCDGPGFGADFWDVLRGAWQTKSVC